MTALRVIEAPEVRRLITGAEALQVVEGVFRSFGEGRSRLSQPSALTLDGTGKTPARFKVKGAAVDPAGLTGFRVITNSGQASYCYLCDGGTGTPLGLVDETWLHKLRTAATAVLAVKHLARPGARVFTLFGTGVIAEEFVPLLSLAVGVEELRVLSRRRESTEAFVARHRPRMSFPVVAAGSPRVAVQEADVVVTLTEATQPIVERGWLGPGGLVCSMGSHHEVDFDVLQEADRFIVDDLDYAMELGDAAAWLRAGQITRDQLTARMDADLAQVVSGARPGRRHEADRILAIVQGMAIGDVALAGYVLTRAGAMPAPAATSV
jgi:ornithine cyclodeaminase